MKITWRILVISIFTVSVGTLSAAAPDEDSKSAETNKAIHILEMAVMTLNNVFENPGNGIPESLVNQSEAIVIFPRACQVAAGAFNGAGGKGIALIFNEEGVSSNLFFVTLREGSLGFQIGPQTSDIVLLIKNMNDLLGLDHSSIMLGGDVGVEAGPDGNVSFSATEYEFKTRIYSYHLKKGLFTGVNLKGAILGYSGKLDNSIYSDGSQNDDQVNELFFALNMFRE
jgi:lipid-binding SYLF domain-containing protein